MIQTKLWVQSSLLQSLAIDAYSDIGIILIDRLFAADVVGHRSHYVQVVHEGAHLAASWILEGFGLQTFQLLWFSFLGVGCLNRQTWGVRNCVCHDWGLRYVCAFNLEAEVLFYWDDGKLLLRRLLGCQTSHDFSLWLFELLGRQLLRRISCMRLFELVEDRLFWSLAVKFTLRWLSIHILLFRLIQYLHSSFHMPVRRSPLVFLISGLLRGLPRILCLRLLLSKAGRQFLLPIGRCFRKVHLLWIFWLSRRKFFERISFITRFAHLAHLGSCTWIHRNRAWSGMLLALRGRHV